MTSHKRQHFVPKSYLTPWRDPASPKGVGHIWVFTKDGTTSVRRSPRKVFREDDLYTIPLPAGGRGLRLEHGLGALEQRYREVRDGALAARAPLAVEEFAILCMFTAAMHARSPRFRDHQRRQWGEALAKGKRLEAAMLSIPAERRRGALPAMNLGGPALGIEDIQQIVDYPMQTSLVPTIEGESEALSSMTLSVLCTDDPIGFITSDHPYLAHDPEARSRPFPYNVLGLGYPKAEVLLPVSPRQLLAFHNRERSHYIDITADSVATVNAGLRLRASDYIVSCSSRFDPRWLAVPASPLKKA